MQAAYAPGPATAAVLPLLFTTSDLHVVVLALHPKQVPPSAWLAGRVLGGGGVGRLQALSDLAPLVAADAAGSNTLHWMDDVPLGFRRGAYHYSPLAEGSPNTSAGARRTVQAVQAFVPVDGSVPLMYYRPDVLARLNLTVPRTWTELLHVAGRAHGLDMNGDGEADYGVCLQPGIGEWRRGARTRTARKDSRQTRAGWGDHAGGGG